MDKLAIVILAAGLGKRMGSTLPKVSISTREKPLINHVLSAVSTLETERVVVITGYQREVVEKVIADAANISNGKPLFDLGKIQFAFQEKQLGTGHAVKCALPNLEGITGSVLILCGDTPLVQSKTLQKLIDLHQQNKSTISLISFLVESENQYGRVLRDSSGKFVTKIVEAKDCTPEQLSIKEVNSGIYLVDSAFLKPALEALKNENSQAEFYITDILESASREGQTISALVLNSSEEVLGVNTLFDLSNVNKALIMRNVRELIEKGVIVDHPESLIVDSSAEIAAGAHIGPNVQILGNSKIARGVTIEGSAFIKDSIIDENVVIKFSVRIENTKIGKNCSVGPFAHLRPESVLEEDCKIGNFVETKKTHLKKGAKANHLTYLGDCEVGSNSNIGAGTITCNYDGYKKSQTIIGENVFIGSNSSLVAPVQIEDGATVGAGSVITKTVEKDSLAFTRSPQLAKKGWSKKKREGSKKNH